MRFGYQILAHLLLSSLLASVALSEEILPIPYNLDESRSNSLDNFNDLADNTVGQNIHLEPIRRDGYSIGHVFKGQTIVLTRLHDLVSKIATSPLSLGYDDSASRKPYNKRINAGKYIDGYTTVTRGVASTSVAPNDWAVSGHVHTVGRYHSHGQRGGEQPKGDFFDVRLLGTGAISFSFDVDQRLLAMRLVMLRQSLPSYHYAPEVTSFHVEVRFYDRDGNLIDSQLVDPRLSSTIAFQRCHRLRDIAGIQILSNVPHGIAIDDLTYDSTLPDKEAEKEFEVDPCPFFGA